MKYKSFNILCLTMVAAIMLTAPVRVWGATVGTLDIRVSAGNDDVEEDNSDGSMERTSSDLEMIDDASYNGADQIIGIRFQGIAIPAGSTITNAYIEFTVDETNSGDTDLTIKGEKSTNALQFSSTAHDVSSRTATDASVQWFDIPAWTSVNDEKQTVDLKDIVQEIIDLSGWSSGNSMAFLIEGTAGSKRVAVSYDGDNNKAPLLHIEYTSDVVEVYSSGSRDDAEENSLGSIYYTSTDLEMVHDSSDQNVGIRFPNVAVPKGAMITSAYLVFSVDETPSGETNLTIKGQAGDNAAEFSSTSYDISNRATTGANVQWNDIPYWDTAHEKKQSPDISTIIQEIVGRSGWSSGNAVAIIITGSGKRTVESYDGASGHGDLTLAPMLHIEYGEDPAPIISVDKNDLGASCYVGNNASPDQFIITNSGSVAMSYTVADDASWVTLSSGSGTLSAGSSDTITVTYTTSALSQGTHEATITITDANAPNSPFEIDVSLTILALPPGSSCGHVPVYTENLVSPAILVLLDVSSSMTSMMNVSPPGDAPQTPDLKTIVQEIVDRDTWTNGNSMAFIITGSGHRTAVSYDGQSGSAPLLHVDYNDGTAKELEVRVSQSTDDAEERSDGSMYTDSSDLELVHDGSDQTIGLRFHNITIDQGATITNAYLVFEIDESQSETTSLVIYGQDYDDPPTFSGDNHNISNRTKTSASVAWNASTTPALEEWGGVTQQSRIQIGKDAISDLVKDRSISWGYGTWCGKTDDGYLLADNYTKVHLGCKDHTDQHQTDLQAEIAATVSHSGTPFMDSLKATRKYFTGDKTDEVGDAYTAVDCQPMFLIDVTDGLGYYGSSVDTIGTETNNLADNNISAVAVGFGIDNATQINEMARVANLRGNASDTDSLYALHNEVGGVGVPFLANSKDELVNALSTITETIKANIFHGSSPAPTTSADLGDTVLVAKFDASDWSGDLEAISQAADGDWDNIVWAASDNIPLLRNVFTIDPSNPTSVIEYGTGTLNNDNWLCKPIGDIINSTPIVVGSPPWFYSFDSYEIWRKTITRDTLVYIGANDGSLHAFGLSDGVEKWAFVPENLQAKLNMADNPTYDMCDDEYCHQYFVDGSPVVGDIYDTSGATDEWKTILVCGEREGGEAYFALDITWGKSFDDASDPTKFLWQFEDTELGQTWSDASISRVADGSAEVWGVFFGSGYSSTDQDNKEAYLYGIMAHDKSAMWNDGTTDINRIKLFNKSLLGYDGASGNFSVNEEIIGGTSNATATIVAINAADGTLEIENIAGTFTDNEVISGGTSGTTADVNGALITTLLNDALSPTLVADLDSDNISDRIYTGNLYGTMYRVSNIGKGENPTITKLFNFSPSLTSPNQNSIRAKPGYSYAETSDNIWVYFGTGRYESQIDKTNMTQQYFFGIKDDLNAAVEYDLNDLVSLEAKYTTDETTGQEVRYIEGTNPSKVSWAMKLDNSSSGMLGSERVIEQPLIVAGVVFFTTFIPDQDVCAGNGDAWVFAVDYNTGLAPDRPVFDLNGDGVIDELDIATDEYGNTYNVAAISVGDGQASNPVLHGNTLFINTTGGGLSALPVNLENARVKLGTWTHRF